METVDQLSDHGVCFRNVNVFFFSFLFFLMLSVVFSFWSQRAFCLLVDSCVFIWRDNGKCLCVCVSCSLHFVCESRTGFITIVSTLLLYVHIYRDPVFLYMHLHKSIHQKIMWSLKVFVVSQLLMFVLFFYFNFCIFLPLCVVAKQVITRATRSA